MLVNAVLIYAVTFDENLGISRDPLSPAKKYVLLIHRDRQNDFHSGKWNGLGGKIIEGESPAQAARREFQEESGIALSDNQFESKGFILFPQFRPELNQDWKVHLFLIRFSAEMVNALLSISTATFSPVVQNSSNEIVPFASHFVCPEGKLYWVETEKAKSLPMWPADREFFSPVIEGHRVEGTITYFNTLKNQNQYRAELRFS